MSNSSKHRVPPYRRPLIVGGFLLLVAVIGIVTVLIFKNLNPTSTTEPDSSRPGTSVTKPDDDAPGTDDRPTEPPLEDKAPSYEGEDPNMLGELTGVIVYKDIDPETSTLHSAVSINQYLSADGQCIYNLKRGDAILRTASAVATPDVTTSVCGPFNLSVDGLDSGVYQIEVIVTGDDKRGVITDEVTI